MIETKRLFIRNLNEKDLDDLGLILKDDETMYAYEGAFSDDDAYENIIFAYYGANSTVIYRQWVADGKKLSLSEVTDLAVNLVCYGLSSIMKK